MTIQGQNRPQSSSSTLEHGNPNVIRDANGDAPVKVYAAMVNLGPQDQRSGEGDSYDPSRLCATTWQHLHF